jgi:thioredoxin-like negative regulator of GroEL
MTARGLVSIAAAVAMLPAGLIGFTRTAQDPGSRKPQVVSALGRQYFARADTDGAIAKAGAALAADPGNLDLIIAAARAHDVALQFDASIALYTKAIDMAPDDVRAYRFRGHRYISTRKFDLAIKDLERAFALAPSSFDVAYHLGLAYFMTAQFPAAAKTYQGCLDRKTPGTGLPEGWRDCAALASTAAARDEESRIGMSDWLYRSLRRAGRADQAKALLAGVPEGLAVKENEAYYRALLFYKGVRTEAQVLPDEAFKENTGVSVGYGLANFYLAEGQTAKACALMQRLVEDEAHWNAFGFIGAEGDLARASGPCAAAAK